MNSPKKDKLKNVVLLLILLVIIIFGIWFVLSQKSKVETTNVFTNFSKSTKVEHQKLPSKEIFDNLLNQDNRFKQLKDFREVPDFSGKKGRANPFLKMKSNK